MHGRARGPRAWRRGGHWPVIPKRITDPVEGKNNNLHDANLEAEVGELAALVLGARVAHVTVRVDVYHVVHHVVVGSEGEQEPDHQKVCQSERCMERLEGWRRR